MANDRKRITLVSNEKIAETSSKGNQEKWKDGDWWYKLDHFGYEALSETVVSKCLELSNIETDTPFTFVRYEPIRVLVHGRDRVGCKSKDFLTNGQSIITINRLLSSAIGCPLYSKLSTFNSNKKRIHYLADAVRDCTMLDYFKEYLTILFEIDALFLNDDRHLNNIAVLKSDDGYDYCPIFDNGAALLSDIMSLSMDINPSALIPLLRARPFNTSFTRQMNTARSLFGTHLCMPKLNRQDLYNILTPVLDYYPIRDRTIISDRVVSCILQRQKYI